MKKLLAILVLAMFLGGIAAPVFALDNTTLVTMSTLDDDPKKTKKSEKKSADCDTKVAVEASGCGEKASDCKGKASDCDAKAKKDCGDKK